MIAAILGANGYTGMVLSRIALQHPEITAVIPSSRSLAGTPVAAYDPGIPARLIQQKMQPTGGQYIAPDELSQYSPEVIFSALPHLVSADICAAFIGKVPVIDLSADFRLRSEERFQAAYGQARPQPQLQSQAVYGLVEWYREALRTANLVAVPGCYPTATMLPLIPFLQRELLRGTIVVNAMSGITGAGKKANTRLLLAERAENLEAYLPGSGHRHWNEIGQEIARFSGNGDRSSGDGAGLELLFTPHLVPIKQGMLVTTAVELAKTAPGEAELRALLTQAYADAPLVEVLPEGVLPQTRSVRGTGRCQIALRREGQSLMLFSAIDNLYKGAAAQAVQVMNVRMGYPEDCGIPGTGEV